MKKVHSLLFLILFILLCIYSFFIEPNKLEVSYYKLRDSEIKNIKIVFASDFHIKPYQQKRLKKIVELINNQNADLVLSVGDYVSGHSVKSSMDIGKIAKELSRVKSKYGFFTTLGNHDNWQDSKNIIKVLEKNNIRVLSNNNVKLRINNKNLYIAGLEDLMTGKPEIYKALNGVDSSVILLSHSPDVFPHVPRSVNLTLAGHTHGGQVRLFFFGALFTGSRYGEKYIEGLVSENGKKLITTRGIGTSILPVRFNCAPEIVVVEFE